MTPYQARILAHLVAMANQDKGYAWAASKHYAELDKYELAQMPELLKQAMQDMSNAKNNRT
jgi:hypothetical protein